MTGAGGENTFCVGDCSGFVDTAEMAVEIDITAVLFANEITWDIDGDARFGVNPAFSDNSVTSEMMTLPAGEHTIHYFDSYGDGWHGGYWEIKDCLGATIAGGSATGQVTNDGGESVFVVADGLACPEVADACSDVVCPAAGACQVAGVCSLALGGQCTQATDADGTRQN